MIGRNFGMGNDGSSVHNRNPLAMEHSTTGMLSSAPNFNNKGKRGWGVAAIRSVTRKDVKRISLCQG